MSKKPTILTIGKATQDVFLTSSKNFAAHRHKGVLYEQLPLGKKLDLDAVVFSTGGNATNAAVTFARQGLHSQYMWALGTELSSETILHNLDAEGVDTSKVVQSEEYRASYSTILLSNNGERTILNYHGFKLSSSGYPLDFSALQEADWLYVSSLGDLKLLEKVVALAAKHDVKVMLNPAGSELAESAKLKALLGDVDVLAVNKEEAKMLVRGETLEELIRHLTKYCETVIISDGPKGVIATNSQEIIRAGMYEDVPVVDRTGAGDAFGSGFLAMYSQGKSLQESVVFASANSTSVVTKIGAKEGILHSGAKLHHMPIDTKPF